jgi:hypothetical protein
MSTAFVSGLKSSMTMSSHRPIISLTSELERQAARESNRSWPTMPGQETVAVVQNDRQCGMSARHAVSPEGSYVGWS